MTPTPNSDTLLVDRIRAGNPDAWNELISRYEGRLLAYAQSRLRNRSASEDVVQETFIGFLTSLPNYDRRRPLEGYLFSIAAHKLTDHLRREGRRPVVPLSSGSDSSADWEPAGRGRPASSIMRSGERRGLEQWALIETLRKQVDHWRDQGQWRKIQCMELLFVRGWGNKQVAAELELTEQQVANFKFEFLARLRKEIARQGLPADVFPELSEGV